MTATALENQRFRTARAAAVSIGLVCIALVGITLTTPCNGGLRPTLVEDATAQPLPRLELDLPAAPAEAMPLEPADPALPAESSVDDALVAWAASRGIIYRDACTRITPGPDELCDVATERDTVRLLGPSADDIWYVVTVEQSNSFDFGTGYRVVAVDLAGDY